MFRFVKGIKLFYEFCEGSGDAVVLLHGWGADHNAFAGSFRSLRNAGRTVLSVDFPCFGQSDKAPCDFGVYDFALCIDELIASLQLTSCVLIGHSFGGRICLILGSRPYVKKMVVTGCAGLKPRFSLIKFLKVKWYKLKKKLGVVNPKGGSADFRKLDSCTRKIFVRIVNTHLDALMKEILCPVLIVWGRNDKETPPYMAKRLRRGIQDSAVVFLQGGHFAYAYENEQFNTIVKAFIKE